MRGVASWGWLVAGLVGCGDGVSGTWEGTFTEDTATDATARPVPCSTVALALELADDGAYELRQVADVLDDPACDAVTPWELEERGRWSVFQPYDSEDRQLLLASDWARETTLVLGASHVTESASTAERFQWVRQEAVDGQRALWTSDWGLLVERR